MNKGKINFKKSFDLLKFYLDKPIKEFSDFKMIRTIMEVIIND